MMTGGYQQKKTQQKQLSPEDIPPKTTMSPTKVQKGGSLPVPLFFRGHGSFRGG